MTNNGSQALVVVGSASGIALIEPKTPLTRLNYFDGKFLRAADLDIEQRYLRRLVAVSNQGLGGGVVYGFDTILATGDRLQIGPGFAVDSAGDVMLMSQAATLGIQDLIEASRKHATPAPGTTSGSATFADCATVSAPATGTLLPVSDLYVIAICPAEALCGEEAVYGKLCEEACITSSNRPYRLEGVIVRAIPLQLVTPFPTSKAVSLDSSAYLRSKVAHSFYADEARSHPHAIRRDGLLSGTWCLGAGYEIGGCEVPLAVLARAGSTTLFLDAWIVRRERMDAPGRRYWEWKMMMRPWDVFLAQVLQFQCQLGQVLSGGAPGQGGDPCATAHAVLGDASKLLAAVSPTATSTGIGELQARIQEVLKGAMMTTGAKDRILIRGGIIELPSAGYLPIVVGTLATVNDQVRALLGDGLDLRFCVVRPDYVPRALESAQHMERISLLEGLERPAARPEVDVLVPDGMIVKTGTTGTGFDVAFSFRAPPASVVGLGPVAVAATAVAITPAPPVFRGVGRTAQLAAGGGAAYFAGLYAVQDPTHVVNFATAIAGLATANTAQSLEILRGFAAAPTAATGAAAGASAVSPEVVAGLRAAIAATLDVAAVAILGLDAAVWVSLRCERNPYDLALADTTPFGTELMLVAPAARQVLLRMQLSGTFRVTQAPFSTSNGRTLVGHISALYNLTVAIQGSPPVDKSGSTDLNASLLLSGTSMAGSLHIGLASGPQAILRYDVGASWSGTPLGADFRLAIQAGESGPLRQLAVGHAIENAAVLAPDSASHQRSVAGIALIGKELTTLGRDGTSYVDAAQQALFPTAAPTEELIIRPTMDWALFHRRRRKDCMAGAPVIRPPRSYRVFNVTVDDSLKASALAHDLTLGDALGKKVQELAGTQPDLVVRFAGASAQALFSFATVDTEWKLFQPGNTIAVVIFGAVGDDDAALQTSRLRQLEVAIESDSREDAKSELIPVVPFPPKDAPPDADGIMLFITVAAKPECQHVFGVINEIWNLLVGTISRPGVTAQDIQKSFTDLKNRQLLFDLGRPLFNAKTGDPFDSTQLQSVVGQWSANSRLGTQVLNVATWVTPHDPDEARHLAEANAIAGALVVPGQALTAKSLTGPVAPADVQLDAAPGTPACPVVTLLMGG
jgi:hypothetical protein